MTVRFNETRQLYDVLQEYREKSEVYLVREGSRSVAVAANGGSSSVSADVDGDWERLNIAELRQVIRTSFSLRDRLVLKIHPRRKRYIVTQVRTGMWPPAHVVQAYL